MDTLINYLPYSIIIAFAVYGLIIAFLKSVEFLFNFLPILKTKTYDVLAVWTKNRNLIRAAEAAKIEKTFNETILDFQNELPIGWIRKTSLEWVSKIKPTDLVNGESILRIKPTEFQDENLVSALYHFFRRAMFPELKEVIPSDIQEATSLQICRRAIQEKHPYIFSAFSANFLEPNIKKDPHILHYLEKYNSIDEKGFFTGIFIRELNEIAIRSRHKTLRTKLNEEAESLLTHIQDFLKHYETKSDKDIESDDYYWYRRGPATSYSILLVAKPYKPIIQRYIKRAQKNRDQGIERFYVMGAQDQRAFVEKVIGAINGIPRYKLLEVFDPHRDYRGKRGGLCALFIVKKK